MHPVEGTSGYLRSGEGGSGAWARVPWTAAGRGRSGLAGHRAPAPAAAPRRGGGAILPEGGQGETFGMGTAPRDAPPKPGPHHPAPARQPPPRPGRGLAPQPRAPLPAAPCRRARPPGAGAVAHGARGFGSGRGGAPPPVPRRWPVPRVAAAAGAEGGRAGRAGGGGGRRRGGGRAGAGRGPGGGRRASGRRRRRRARRDVRAGGAPVQGRRAQAAPGAAAAGPGAGRAAALGGRQDGRAPGAAGPRRPRHPRHPRRGPRPLPGPRLAARGHRRHPGREYARAGTRSTPRATRTPRSRVPAGTCKTPLLPKGQGSPGRDARPTPGGPERDPPAPPCAERGPQLLCPPGRSPCGSRLVPGRPLYLPPPLGISTFSEPGPWSPSSRPPPPTSVLAKPSSFSSPHFILHPAPSRDASPGPPSAPAPAPRPYFSKTLPPTHPITHTIPGSRAIFLVRALDLKPLCPQPFCLRHHLFKSKAPSPTAFLSPFSRTGAIPHPL